MVSSVEVFRGWACLSEDILTCRYVLVINYSLLLYLLPTESPLIIIDIVSISTVVPYYPISRSRCWPRHWPYSGIIICNNKSRLSLNTLIIRLHMFVNYYSLVITVINRCVYLFILWWNNWPSLILRTFIINIVSIYNILISHQLLITKFVYYRLSLIIILFLTSYLCKLT